MVKNQAGQATGAELLDATTGAAFSGTVTVYITGDNGSQVIGSVGSGICTDEGNGYFTYQPSQAETNYDLIAFTFTGTGAVPATAHERTSRATKNLSGQVVGAQMVDASTGAAFSGAVTVYITGDAGTQALAGVGVDKGNGYFTYAPTQAETNYDLIAFTFVGSGAIRVTIQVPTTTVSTGTSITFSSLYDDALHVELGTNDTAVLFTSARRKHAVNDGYHQFADLTECFIQQPEISVSQGEQDINLSTLSGFLRLASDGPVFEISDSNGVAQTLAGDDFPQVSEPFLDHARSGWRSTEAAYPTSWHLKRIGGRQYLRLSSPLGLSSGSTQTAALILPYVAEPSSMTSDTNVPFKDADGERVDLRPYYSAMVHYAAHDLEKLRKDPEASDRQLKKFQGYVQRYLDAHRPKGNRVVRTAISYFTRARRGR